MSSFWDLNNCDFMTRDEILVVVFGYFRDVGFLDYNVKSDDFVNIVSKYITEKSIKIGNPENNIRINAFKGRSASYVDILNKQFMVACESSSSTMLSHFLFKMCLIIIIS